MKGPVERPWRLLFDGGSIGNPGRAYGSFRVTPGRQGEPPVIQRLEFGRGTNNEAEYWSLLAGLKEVARRVEAEGRKRSETELEVRGDSKLILEQVRGRWKVKEPRLQPLCRQAQDLASRFRSVRWVHQPRSQTVRALGH